MSWRVPLADVQIPEEDVEAVLETLRSGWLTMGPRTQDFERAVAEYIGAEHAVAVSSCTAALHLACIAAGLGPGDEAIVPGFTFVSTANAVRYVGADPVLCEIVGPHDMNMDVEDVERRITPRTKAVIPVHFAGYPAAVEDLRALCDERGLVMIEDCAHAIGAQAADDGRKAGTIGELGCFSLFSKKQLCVGEGGIVVTDDEEMATRVRLLRSHAMTSVTWDRHRGYAQSYDVVDIGFNFRLDETRAALALSRLGRLEDSLEKRRAVARAYRDRLSGIDGIELCWDDEGVERGTHFAFAILLRDQDTRDAFRESMHEQGVQTTWYPALNRFTEYVETYGELSLPRVEELAERHCALPMASSMSEEDIDVVVEAVANAVAAQLDPTR